MAMNIEPMKFEGLDEILAVSGEAMVFLGCGGDLQEWVNGVSKLLVEEGIAKDAELMTEVHLLTTTGGRQDLVMVPDWTKLDEGKLAIWRLMFGDVSWLSDYVVNYRKQH